MGSLDALCAYLAANDTGRQACGFGDFVPSRSIFSQFMHFLGPQPLQDGSIMPASKQLRDTSLMILKCI
ncbi:MAG: hypothetical protein IH840_00265 [Candidatus Heimdallarchaeota archaeon]|nr:hypothetical protein [Candidatus Heimdallarchaeota archaeon]